MCGRAVSTRVCISYVDKHVRVEVCDLAPACVYVTMHCVNPDLL
jgi:hypothetical protein